MPLGATAPLLDCLLEEKDVDSSPFLDEKQETQKDEPELRIFSEIIIDG